MLYALDTYGKKILAQPDMIALCPFCNGPMRPKCGEVKRWHWAHKDASECDPGKEAETEWHLNWKSLFPPEHVEVTVEKNGKRHRADVKMPHGLVVEFQNSPIPYKEIRDREWFYDYMVWIWNAIDAFSDDRINITRHEDHRAKMEWEHPKRQFRSCQKPLYLDLGEDLFYVEDCKESVSEMGEDNFGGHSYTIHGEIYGKDEVIERLSNPPEDLGVWCLYPCPSECDVEECQYCNKREKVRFVNFEVCEYHREEEDPNCEGCEQWQYPIKRPVLKKIKEMLEVM